MHGAAPWASPLQLQMWPLHACSSPWHPCTVCLLTMRLTGGLWGAVAAVVATRNDAELAELFSDSGTFDLSFFSNSTVSQFLRHFLLKGVLQDVEVLQKRLRRLLGDATFLQAFAHSGRG